MADAFVGRVLAALEAAGVDEDTLLIVTSDHGEEFGEHGFFGHGETLHEANTRIPFVARLPGPRAERAGRVLQQPISLADIAPWVLRVVGLEPDPRMVVAAPLAPEQLDPPGRSLLFIELDNQLTRRSAVVRGQHKLHVHLEQEREPLPAEVRRLFDLGADPDETVDLVAEQPELVDELRGILDGFHGMAARVMPRDGGPTDYSGMSVEQLQQLAALGYLSVEQLDTILEQRQGE
jgi:arylsulfatase A-like enzyme